jgi:hypothetical protein
MDENQTVWPFSQPVFYWFSIQNLNIEQKNDKLIGFRFSLILSGKLFNFSSFTVFKFSQNLFLKIKNNFLVFIKPASFQQFLIHTRRGESNTLKKRKEKGWDLFRK